MRILVATDGSDNSFEAIHQATQLISAERDQLLLYYSPIYPENLYDWNDEASQAWRNFVSTQVFEKARRHLPTDWSDKVEQIQGSGDPRSEIIQVSEKRDVDLIIVGARGLGSIGRFVLGGVSHAVAHAAKLPVLIARKKPTPSEKMAPSILVACEGANSAKRLIHLLNRFRWPAGTTLQLLSVIKSVLPGRIPSWLANPHRSAETEAMIETWVRQQEELKKTSFAALDELSSTVGDLITTKPLLIKESNVEQEILNVAKAQDSDLIVVGAKASTPLGRLLIGSTAGAVLNHAECSVLLVHHAE